MTRLYRPVGLNELALIWDSGCREFPPRLPDQPIFYPVTSAEYATQIARDWNTKSSTFAGYVTSFELDDFYLSRFERHIVGAAVHEEYWIPAQELPNFNKAISGLIKVDAGFFGESFSGFIPDKAGFKEKNAEEQFIILATSWNYNRMDFTLEISVNRKAVFLNCMYWVAHDFTSCNIDESLKSSTIAGVIEAWKRSRLEPGLPVAFTTPYPRRETPGV